VKTQERRARAARTLKTKMIVPTHDRTKTKMIVPTHDRTKTKMILCETKM
jgi:hypothetical protein